MELHLADIATNESHTLEGFKVMGVFPFRLKLITTETHIRLCRIKAKLQQIKKEEDATVDDFYDPEVQEQAQPLINEYIVTALLNGRSFSMLLRPFLKRKLKRCAHSHILNLYMTVFKLNEPAFFLTYWRPLLRKDSTLLKEVER